MTGAVTTKELCDSCGAPATTDRSLAGKGTVSLCDDCYKCSIRGNAKFSVKLEAFEPCPHHAPAACGCPKVSAGIREIEHDLATQQFAQLVQLNLLGTAETITDTSNASHSETANTASGTVTILAGTGSTAAAYNDYTLQTQTETVGGTVNAYSGSGTSGSFTVTGTITATSNRAYAEVGLRVTVNAHLYLLCHDVFSVLNVSNTGTLAVTYTLTFS